MSRPPNQMHPASPIIGALQKPIQIVQPLQPNFSSTTAHQPIGERINCSPHLINQRASPLPIMATPVSSSISPYLQTPGASFSPLAIPMVTSQTPPPNCSQPQNNGTKQGIIQNQPFVYQGVPVGQPILLTNSNSGGIIFAQSPNNMIGSQPYIIPSNAQHHNPQFVPFSGNSLLRPASRMPIGAMVVLTQGSGTQNHPGFLQLPAESRLLQHQQSYPISSQSLSHSPIISSTNQVVCMSAGSNIQQHHPIQPQMLPYAQFPTGLPYTRLQNGVSMSATIGFPQSVPTTSIAGTISVSTIPGNNNSAPTTVNRIPNPINSATHTTKMGSQHNTDSVIRQLDVEIADLKRLSSLTVQQEMRLKNLRFARETVVRAALSPGLSQQSGTPRPWLPTTVSTATGTTTIQPRPPPVISPSIRSEVMDILKANHLIQDSSTPINLRDTFLIEFRLMPQRYHLRLTRGQKEILERLLLNSTPIRKAQILCVFQQEQNRCLAAIQQFQQQRFANQNLLPNSSVSTSHPMASVLAQQQLTPRPPQQPMRLIQTRSPFAPGATRPSNVAAQSSMGMCMLAPSMRQPISSFGGISSQDIFNTVTSSSSSSSAVQLITTSTVNSTNATILRPTLVTPSTLISSAPSSLSSVIRPPSLSLQQAARLSAIRGLIHKDHLASVAIPSVALTPSDKCTSLPTCIEMADILAPYHVFQDLDNSQHAIAKVDQILDKAFNQLYRRKRQTEDAVNSILFAEKWKRMEATSTDRLEIARLALQSDKERLTTERASFDLFLTSLSVATSDSLSPHNSNVTSLFKDLLNDADFCPLTFDEVGNSTPAVFSFDVEEEEVDEKISDNLQSSPLPPALLRSEDIDVPNTSGAPPSLDSAPSPSLQGAGEEEEEFSTTKVEEDEEEDGWPEWVQEDSSAISPELDMANVVKDDVDEAEGEETHDKRNGSWNTSQFLFTNNVLEPSFSQRNSHLSLNLPDNTVQHSEDPDLDAAIRSIIG